MPPLHPVEVLPERLYSRARSHYLQRVLEARRLRRFDLGPATTVVFETRETVLFLIHEILRLDRVWTAERIAHEVAEYADLVPSHRRLAATVLLSGRDVRRMNRLAGALTEGGEVLRLRCGASTRAARVVGAVLPSSNVHYVSFDVSEVRDSLAETRVELELDCDGECAVVELDATQRAALVADLQ